jgi:hypothetical protein
VIIEDYPKIAVNQKFELWVLGHFHFGDSSFREKDRTLLSRPLRI